MESRKSRTARQMVHGMVYGKNILVKLALKEMRREGKCQRCSVGGHWQYGIDEYQMADLFEIMSKIVPRLNYKKMKSNDRTKNELERL